MKFTTFKVLLFKKYFPGLEFHPEGSMVTLVVFIVTKHQLQVTNSYQTANTWILTTVHIIKSMK